MTDDRRVALRRNPGWTGFVTRIDRKGVIHVTGDTGWTGKVSEDDIVDVDTDEEAERVATEDKSWPPKDMESK